MADLPRLVAGVDCSTQATKVLLVDPVTGRLVASGCAAHDVTGRHGWRETDPAVWWTALRDALAQTRGAGRVAAISVASQQHGLVVCDDGGRPLRPAILWNDTRSAREAEELCSALGADGWAGRVGVVPVPSFTVTRWAWLRRHEPEVAASTASIHLPHDWLTHRLCDRHVTDRGDASGTGWWSTLEEDYSQEVLDLARLDRALLPQVLGHDETAGEITPAAAEGLGLSRDVLVGPGTGDNMAAALGLGMEPGETAISLGTSGTAFTVAAQRTADASGQVAGFADATGRYLPLVATLNCTLAVDRVAEWLGLDRDETAETTEVTVLPYLDGERTPNLPDAAGMIFGLRHSTTREEILLGAYEGAAASLAEALDRLHEQSSDVQSAAPILLIGGGANGRSWQRVLARISGRLLQVPDAPETVALGAAAQAASCLLGESAVDIAKRWGSRAGARITPPVEPDTETLARVRSTRAAAEGMAESASDSRRPVGSRTQ